MLGSPTRRCFPPGSRGSDDKRGVAHKVLAEFVRWPVPDSGQAPLPSGNVVWAAVPITASREGKPSAGSAPTSPSTGAASTGASGKTEPSVGETTLGMLYVEVPATAPGIGGVTVSPRLVRTGLVLLVAAFPVGARVRAAVHQAADPAAWAARRAHPRVGDGDFRLRVPVRRARRGVPASRRTSTGWPASFRPGSTRPASSARPTPGTRSARASPANCTTPSPRSCSRSTCSPAACAGRCPRVPGASAGGDHGADRGRHDARDALAAARAAPGRARGGRSARRPGGVCQAYRDRLGIPVHAEVDLAGLGPDGLPPAVEHAMLRVTQEAVSNAARHADPAQITVRLSGNSGQPCSRSPTTAAASTPPSHRRRRGPRAAHDARPGHRARRPAHRRQRPGRGHHDPRPLPAAQGCRRRGGRRRGGRRWEGRRLHQCRA